ncbi:Valyl-tRNA synthetase [Richelia intracellularis HH01]|uniref:Valyl-tRNA synthetase n=1 Tax=Richelia intracellularis HH01 TaxID=1165094 RepID=M1X5J5_9NOST|nr:Valyl-tRNA synthetase [Richelia intracellularis HH01]
MKIHIFYLPNIKTIMTENKTNLPNLYEPFAIEAKWQKFWEDNQVYKADPNHPGEPYCIVMPPPKSYW